MVKFCLQCKSAFWGGKFCPICEGEILLLDAALPENKQYLSQLNIDVRPKYYARSSMLLSCFGFIMSLPLGMFIFLRGMANSGNGLRDAHIASSIDSARAELWVSTIFLRISSLRCLRERLPRITARVYRRLTTNNRSRHIFS